MRIYWDKMRARLREIAGANETPSHLAAAWAVGVGVALSPFLGFHLIMAIVLAFLFRLNKVDVLLGTLVINPWTLAVYFPAAVVVGRWLTGVHLKHVVLPHPAELFDMAVWRQQGVWLKPLVIAWMFGASLLAFIAAAVTFYGMRALIVRMRAKHARRVAQSGGVTPPASPA